MYILLFRGSCDASSSSLLIEINKGIFICNLTLHSKFRILKKNIFILNLTLIRERERKKVCKIN